MGKNMVNSKNNAGTISIVKVDEKLGKSSSLDTVAAIFHVMVGMVACLTSLIFDLIKDAFNANIPDLGGRFDSITTETVVWPYQRKFEIKDVLISGHLVFTLDILL